MTISVVINTLNEEKNIIRVINSVKFASEVIVCDMYSDDQTVKRAKKLGAKVIYHRKTGYVEPARNFAISKANGEWILILDADEEIPNGLADRLQELSKTQVADYVEIPRQNIIFNKWMQASFWWPDNNIRFFKRGSVRWNDKIHSKPQTTGVGLTLPANKELAIIHHHYSSISQFIQRMDRYTTVQANDLKNDGVVFKWNDLIHRPTSEFLGRFFANRGFEDGVHGLALCLLQAFSFFVVYLKLWELNSFKESDLDLKDLKQEVNIASHDLSYWFKYGNLSKHPIKNLLQRIKNKVT